MELQLQSQLDHELIHDIQGRMILHWNYRNLREIPAEVLNYGEHIEEIYLKRNCLEKLPPDIGKLCNLTNLYLVGNQLEELPIHIGDLKCLRVLDVSQNYIRKLPETVGGLQHLESLMLTYNQLEELPRCLKTLHRLKELEVSGNRIHCLPKEIIEGLQSLEQLGIDRNPINSIPRNICLLNNLSYFSACRCNLLLLPAMPFHKLLNNRVSPTSSRQQGTAGNMNKNLQFLFDGNPRLNYVPYWVLQLLGTNVECFGCGLEPGESDNSGTNPAHPYSATSQQTQLQLYTYHGDVNRPKIKLNFKGKRRTLHFDEDLVKLHHCGFNVEIEEGAMVKVAVLSLLELCFRQVHSLGLLEKTAMKKCGVKPVVEPLIVPQRAGDSLINIRGNLEARRIIQGDFGDGIRGAEPTANNIHNISPLVEIPPETEKGETAMKSDEKEDDGACSSHHHRSSGESSQKGKNDHHNHAITETGSTTEKETNQNQTNKDRSNVFSHEDSVSLMLPMNLSRILMAGPVSRCFECLKPIFTESWPIVFHIPGRSFDENDRDERIRMGLGGGNENVVRGDWDDRQEDGKLSIGCTHFCSASCVTRFKRGTQFASNLLLNDLRCIVENEISWSQY